MDKKFLISVGLSLATVWALQYYWYKPAAATGEVALKAEQNMPKAGEPVKVLAREDIFKPMKTEAFFSKKAVGTFSEISIDMPQQVVKVATHGGFSSLEFKKHLNSKKQLLKTISVDENEGVTPPFFLCFDESAPVDYAIVDAGSSVNSVKMETHYKGWLITKHFDFEPTSFKMNMNLSFTPVESSAEPLNPRIFMAAPYVTEFKDDVASTFVFNEHKEEIEKKAAGSEEGFIWYWQTKKTLVGVQNKYFVHALVSDFDKFVQRAYFCKQKSGKSLDMILEGPSVKDKTSWNLSFYLGPKIYEDLVKVDDRLGTVFAGGWFAWLTKLMLKFLDFISKYVKNLGLAIIVLAVLLKLPLVPLSIYSRIKMELYQKHTPIINRIRSKYRGDQQAQLTEVSRYHQEHGISPSTPMIGCLPLILQLPLMYSLYDILSNSLQLYQAPFFGWIVDLSAKDPFYVIPILMGISMIWQQMMAPVNDEKQRVAMFFVSIVMTVVFSGLPVGLVLYWLVNNIVTIVEDYTRRLFFS